MCILFRYMHNIMFLLVFSQDFMEHEAEILFFVSTIIMENTFVSHYYTNKAHGKIISKGNNCNI